MATRVGPKHTANPANSQNSQATSPRRILHAKRITAGLIAAILFATSLVAIPLAVEAESVPTDARHDASASYTHADPGQPTAPTARRTDSNSDPITIGIPQPPTGGHEKPSAATSGSFTFTSTGRTTATVSFTVPSADTYYMRYRLDGDTNWTDLTSQTATAANVDLTFSLTSLEANRQFDVQASTSSTYLPFPLATTERTKFINRPDSKDIAILFVNDNPKGITSNGSGTAWIVNEHDTRNRAYAYTLSDGSYDSSKSFDLYWRNDKPGAAHADDDTLWVSDRFDDKVYAYNISSTGTFGERLTDKEFPLASSNGSPKGMTGDSDTIWIADDGSHRIFAYRKDAGDRVLTSELNDLADAEDIEGIWTDGTIMFAVDPVDDRLYAYDLNGSQRWTPAEMDLGADNGVSLTDAAGIWSDSQTIWIIDNTTGVDAAQAYYIPQPGPGLSGLTAHSNSPTTGLATAHIAYPDSASRFIYLRHRANTTSTWEQHAVSISAADGSFVLTRLRIDHTYTLQASLNSSFPTASTVTTVLEVRPAHTDFALAPGNGHPRGMWSDGTTVWIANDGFGSNNRIYAYDLATGAHNQDKSFDLDPDANGAAGGVHGTSNVLYVTDARTDRILAYSIEEGANYGTRIPAKDIKVDTDDSLFGLTMPHGIWANGNTLWTVGNVRERTFSYNLTAGDNYGKPTDDGFCNLVTEYSRPTGMWGTSDTIWIGDVIEDRIFAYHLTPTTCGIRYPIREIRLSPEHADPWGIWSHENVMYVTDDRDEKVYVYYLPTQPQDTVNRASFINLALGETEVTAVFPNPDGDSKTVYMTYILDDDTTTVYETTTDTDVTFSLTTLQENSRYTGYFHVDGGAFAYFGFRTMAKKDLVENALYYTYVSQKQDNFPWVRETYNGMRRAQVPIHAVSGNVSTVGLNCVETCDPTSYNIGRDIGGGDATDHSYLHELAHVYTVGTGYTGRPTHFVGIGWAYFAVLTEGGSNCPPNELYADSVAHVTNGSPSSAGYVYYIDCSETSARPSAEIDTFVTDILDLKYPSWFDTRYQASGLPYSTSDLSDVSKDYDLEKFNTDVRKLNGIYRHTAYYKLRTAFGGLCKRYGSSSTRNPFQAGGCVPKAPEALSHGDGGGNVILTWNTPDYDGGSPITKYQIEWHGPDRDFDTGSSIDITDLTERTHSLTAMYEGSAVRVTAHNHNGKGISSTIENPDITSDTLVQNTRQTSTGTDTLTSGSRGLSFTTGPNTDGFDLESIGIDFHNIASTPTAGANLRVTLNSEDTQPGDALCTLNDPPSFQSSGVNQFHATGDCPALSPLTTYFVVIERTGSGSSAIVLNLTSSTSEDPKPAPGWSIGNDLYSKPGSSWVKFISQRHQIQVFGTARIGPTVALNSTLVPNGLTAGDKFRLIFLTDAGHAPTSTDIDDYNTYVQAQANATDAHPAVRPISEWFRIAGATADQNMRTNTGTAYSDAFPGVAIYWLAGSKVADHYQDFYDGSWDDESNRTGKDGSSSSHNRVFTGARSDGTTSSDPLGYTDVRVGRLSSNSGNPLGSGTTEAGTSAARPYYALSAVITVGSNSTPTGAPAVSGVTRVSETLTAETSAIQDDNGLSSPAYTYQWFRIVGTTPASISGATNSTYTLNEQDADQTIVVEVSFTDDDDNDEGPLSSPPSETIAAADVLVKNTAQDATSNPQNLGSTNPKRAQAFTTDADPTGYQLTSISFLFHNIANTATADSQLTATLNANNAGSPGTVLCTLDNPSTFSADGIHTFGAATTGTDLCPILSPSTTYFGVIARTSHTSDTIALVDTRSVDEDNGSRAGWAIANNRHYFENNRWGVTASGNHVYQIQVNGDIAPPRVDHLSFTSDPNDDGRQGDDHTYAIGDAVETTVTFNAPVDISGSPQITILFGDTDKTASCAAAMNTTAMVCAYTIAANDAATSGAGVKENSLRPNNGTITGAGEVTAAIINHGPVELQPGHKVDGIRPALLTTGSEAPATSTEGDKVILTFDESLSSADHSKITVRVGSRTRPTSGSTADNARAEVELVTPLTSDDQQLTAALSANAVTDDAGNGNTAIDAVSVANRVQLAPAAPSALTAEPAPNATPQLAINLAWTASSSDGGSPVTKHQYRTMTGGAPFSNWTEIPDSAPGQDNAVSHALTGLTATNPPTTFTFEVRAVNDNGEGAKSNQANAIIDAPDPVVATATAGDSKIYLAWTTPTNNGSAILRYQLWVYDITNSVQTTPWTDIPDSNRDTLGHTITGLSNGIEYSLNVRAINSVGYRAGNPVGPITPAAIPTVPQSDHRMWLDNRGGTATTDYANTGDFKIAQGFRTGNTAGAYEIHQITVDFDRGQPPPKAIQVRIVESSSLNEINDAAIPTGYWKGGNFPKRAIGPNPGTYTFNLDTNQVTGTNILEADTNYFLTIETSSDDPDTAAGVRMTNAHGQTSNDGWTVDDHSYVKSRNDNSRWTKKDHQVRLRIAGQYHEGISIVNEPRAYESCHGNLTHNMETRPAGSESCAFATEVDAGTPGSFPSNLGTKAWLPIYETIDFDIVIWPLVPAGKWVDVEYATEFPPGIYAHGSPAVADVDYVETSGKVRFLPGETTKTVSVNIIDDRHEDSNEYVNVILPSEETRASGVPNYSRIRRSAFGMIYNSEESVGTQYLHIADVAVTEGEGATAVFTVTLDAEVTAPVTVNYATEDDTATAGTDYTAVSGTLLIPHGQTSATISVPILNDETHTGERKFALNLSNPVNAETLRSTAYATIKDDERGPLTAEFGTVPGSHDGSNTFDFFVKFSEGTKTPFLTMQNDVFTITNGTITRAARFLGLRHRWTLTVQPDNGADVGIHLPITTDCSATGAVCTDATPRRALSNSLSATVTGTPLTAEFKDLPALHNNVDAFSFTLAFSEEVDTTPEQLLANGFTTTGGEITAVARNDTSSNLNWTVTVQPDGTDDVMITMAAATDCSADGQICTSAGELLSASQSATVPGTAITEEPPTEDPVAEDPPAQDTVVLLTASFANMPADHNGENFTFELTFSENVDAGYARIRDHALTLDGGTIANASRQTQGSNQGWHVEVDPIGNEAVSITLPETTDCADSGAICTDDERMLSHATSVRVTGPPAISVSDGTVQEAEGAVLVFTATLSHASSRTVTVDYATSDGTAVAGSDYTAASGALTFNAGDTSQTVQVTVLTDSDDEGQETLTLTLSNPSQATLDDATGTGAIENGESTTTTDDPPVEDPTEDPVVLVTATLSGMPATHDGTSFTFELDFSENVKAGYARIRDHAFTINGGEIKSAVRKEQGSNQGWTITVNPNGAADITITLPPTTDCDAARAICTDDDRMLSSSTSDTITRAQ